MTATITAGSGPTGPSPTGPGNPRPVSPPPPPPPPQPTTPPQPVKAHGITSYTNYGCRCEVCCAAMAAAALACKQRKQGTEPPSHGINGYTRYRCRCNVCMDASRTAGRRSYAATKLAQTPPTTLADLPARLRAEVEAELWGAR